MICRLGLLEKMFCILRLRRFRIFTQAHILESLQDVNNLILKNCRLPRSPQFERVLSMSSSSKHAVSAHDPSKEQAELEEGQDGIPRQQMHSYHYDIDATTTRVVSEDRGHSFISKDKQEEVDSYATSKADRFDDASYVSDRLSKKKLKALKSLPKHPLINMGNESKTFTPDFEKCEKFLQSLKIPTFELPHYPDIQEMSHDQLLLYVNRLKDIGIHVAFSLYLIQRMAAEIGLEQTAKRAPLPNLKSSFKLRNGKYKLSSMQAVTLHLKLCQLLEKPELDLYEFINNLASADIYDHLHTLVSKVQQLRSVGATPQDILSNLRLLKGSNVFKAKIQMYNNLFRHSKPVFPVNLFLSSTVAEFREKLQVGNDINVISNLLGVTPKEFLMCWGFKSICISSLMHKVHLLLKAGISKQDLFDNITLINRLSLKKSQSKLESLVKLKSGHSVTLYELKALEDDMSPDVSPTHRDWTSEDESDSRLASLDAKKMPTQNASKKRNLPASKRRSYQSMETSKIWRMEVFNHITHHLQLSGKTRKAMYQANVSVDAVHIQDIAQNLEHLMSSLKFTKEQISACPLILAHPHKDLYRVTLEVESLLEQHFTWSAIGSRPSAQTTDSNGVNLPSSSSESVREPSSSSSSSSSSSLSTENNLISPHIQGNVSQPTNFSVSNDPSEMPPSMDCSILLTDPITRLNVLQYFLEKETGFSMLSTESIVLGN